MPMWRALADLFRKYFVAGLLVVIPSMGTIWILKLIVDTIENFFFTFVPSSLLPQRLIGIRIPGVGLILTMALVLLVGVLTRLVLARQMLRLGEIILEKIPVGRGVYQGIKQLMQLLVGQPESRFSRVVLVEFPQAGSYVYGFVTGSVTEAHPTPDTTGLLHVFVPTAPNPTSGFLLRIPEAKTRPAGLTVEAAMKLIISGGLMTTKEV